MERGGDEKPLYNEKIMSNSRTDIMNERRGAYGCMKGNSTTVFEILKSLERRRGK